MGIVDWGLVIGDWELGPISIPNPQSPIPNPHFVIINEKSYKKLITKKNYKIR